MTEADMWKQRYDAASDEAKAAVVTAAREACVGVEGIITPLVDGQPDYSRAESGGLIYADGSTWNVELGKTEEYDVLSSSDTNNLNEA